MHGPSCPSLWEARPHRWRSCRRQRPAGQRWLWATRWAARAPAPWTRSRVAVRAAAHWMATALPPPARGLPHRWRRSPPIGSSATSSPSGRSRRSWAAPPVRQARWRRRAQPSAPRPHALGRTCKAQRARSVTAGWHSRLAASSSADKIRPVIIRPSLIWNWAKLDVLPVIPVFNIANALGIPFVDKTVLHNFISKAPNQRRAHTADDGPLSMCCAGAGGGCRPVDRRWTPRRHCERRAALRQDRSAVRLAADRKVTGVTILQPPSSDCRILAKGAASATWQASVRTHSYRKSVARCIAA
eukprot:946182-Prymnesium_polylepis.1